MRIDSYGMNTPPVNPAPRRPVAPPQPAADEAEALSPQEKLRQLLEQKRWMAETAFAESPEPELGKHIDLRV